MFPVNTCIYKRDESNTDTIQNNKYIEKISGIRSASQQQQGKTPAFGTDNLPNFCKYSVELIIFLTTYCHPNSCSFWYQYVSLAKS